MSKELWDDLNQVLRKHHTTIAELYWTNEIQNYMECCEDYKDIELSEEQMRNIMWDILDDDHIWQEVDESIDWYIRHSQQ